MNTKLKNYIEENIYPQYSFNDDAHSLNHLIETINKALDLAKDNPLVNIDMLLTTIAYHDVGYYIDPSNHELIASELMYNDINLIAFFSNEERAIIKQALEDHRLNLEYEPRNIYGLIIKDILAGGRHL